MKPTIPATCEVEIQRNSIQDIPGQNVSKTLISINMLRMVECTCNPSYMGDTGRRITAQCQYQAKKCNTLSEE
jgi:hypothetical protein